MIVDDYKLSLYACYLIVQNGDSRKAELTEEYLKEYNNLSEEEKRLRRRKVIKKNNYELNQTARDVGVKNFGKFHNAGYKVGTIVRNSIKEAGGTMPEDLSTLEKSLKELKKEELKKLDGGCAYLIHI